jgi:hypothetical protein
MFCFILNDSIFIFRLRSSYIPLEETLEEEKTSKISVLEEEDLSKIAIIAVVLINYVRIFMTFKI